MFLLIDALRLLAALYGFFTFWWNTGQLRFGIGAYRLVLDCMCLPHEFRRPLERDLLWETRVLLRFLDEPGIRRRDGRVWISIG